MRRSDPSGHSSRHRVASTPWPSQVPIRTPRPQVYRRSCAPIANETRAPNSSSARSFTDLGSVFALNCESTVARSPFDQMSFSRGRAWQSSLTAAFGTGAPSTGMCLGQTRPTGGQSWNGMSDGIASSPGLCGTQAGMSFVFGSTMIPQKWLRRSNHSCADSTSRQKPGAAVRRRLAGVRTIRVGADS